LKKIKVNELYCKITGYKKIIHLLKFILFFGPFILIGCAQSSYLCTKFNPNFNEIDSVQNKDIWSEKSYSQLKIKRSAVREMKNILYDSADQSLNKFKNLRESIIYVTATLYDTPMIINEIVKYSKNDTMKSLDEHQMSYIEKHQPLNNFRIELDMNSGFAKRSLDIKLWTIYLRDENGDMYEPVKVDSGNIVSKKEERNFQDQVFYDDSFKVKVNLYFPHLTFYNQRIVGEDRKNITLVLAYNQEIISEIMWCFSK